MSFEWQDQETLPLSADHLSRFNFKLVSEHSWFLECNPDGVPGAKRTGDRSPQNQHIQYFE